MTAALAVVAAGVAYAAFAVQSLALAVIDVRTHRLPDRWVLPGYPVAGVLLSLAALAAGTPLRVVGVVGGAAALFVFYLALRMLRTGAMGGGDVKLAGVAGAHLGFFGWDAVLFGAIGGFVLGGLYGAGLLMLRRARRASAIPFGPFLLAGAWAAIVVAFLGGG